ncbi:MAG: tRNA dihydrouridine synthase DusB [Firmicutes bacterium]|nr:tRNA dihydrouridine synthase DusB [Bacillota bacterium]
MPATRPLVAAAPMAGISNRAYRDICRAHGADLVYGEMVSATALHYQNRRTRELLDLQGEKSLRLVQLFGSVPEYMAEAAYIVKDLGAEAIDINMGCPVPKVVKNGEGAALMQNPALAQALVQAAARSGLPVSVKIRLGWDEAQRNAADFAQSMEAAGAVCVAVHCRTRMQMYQGQADWPMAAEVKRRLSIPVLVNGDIFSPAQALAALEQSGCDGVMIGRGMLGNPWLFRQTVAVLQGKTPPPPPTSAEIIRQAMSHLRQHRGRCRYWSCWRHGSSGPEALADGELAAVRSMRTPLAWYVRGLPHAAALRRDLNRLTSVAEIEALFAAYLDGKYGP